MNNQINFHQQPQQINNQLLNKQLPLIIQGQQYDFNQNPYHQIQYIPQPSVIYQPIQNKQFYDANEIARVQQTRIHHLEDRIDILSSDYKRSLTNYEFKNKELEQWQLSYNNMQSKLNLHIQRVRQLEQNVDEIKDDHFKLMEACDIRENEYKQIEKIIQEKNSELLKFKQKLSETQNQDTQIAEMEQKIGFLQIENERLRRIKIAQSQFPQFNDKIITPQKTQFMTLSNISPYRQNYFPNVKKY